MANLRVIKSPEAKKDLLAIWSYIAKDSHTAADGMLRLIDREIASLRYAPYRGEAQPQFGESIRRITIGNYVLLYDVGKTVRVLRIFHGARKWEDLL